MSDALSIDVVASVHWLFRDTLDLSIIQDNATLLFEDSLADGTAADQADKVWHDQRSITTGANDDLDLSALTNSIFGSTVTINFAKIKGIMIVNANAVSGDSLRVGGGGSNEFTAIWGAAGDYSKALGPSGTFFFHSPIDGFTVDGTHKTLRISNPGSNTVTYKIVIWGTSA